MGEKKVMRVVTAKTLHDGIKKLIQPMMAFNSVAGI